ncbi:MAG: putative FmdB family regulatory protein [Burkholderiaceae bacterium]|jgi:putative FmdB family regulatory protein
MPIYAYRCEACGFAKDVLQKMSDPKLTDCPECGKDTFRKQLTAAGFQLKGTGWYATDFRGGTNTPPVSQAEPAKASEPGSSTPAAAAPAPAAAPAAVKSDAGGSSPSST